MTSNRKVKKDLTQSREGAKEDDEWSSSRAMENSSLQLVDEVNLQIVISLKHRPIVQKHPPEKSFAPLGLCVSDSSLNTMHFRQATSIEAEWTGRISRKGAEAPRKRMDVHLPKEWSVLRRSWFIVILMSHCNSMPSKYGNES